MPCSGDHHHSVVGEEFQMSVGPFPETFVFLSIDYCCWYLENGGRKRDKRVRYVVLLFHSPTIVKVLGMVGLSFRLLMFLQKMRYRSYPYWWGKVFEGQRNRSEIEQDGDK